MKRLQFLIITAALLLATHSVMGQFGFVESGRQWNVYAMGAGSFLGYNTEIFRFGGDTLIEGHWYKEFRWSYDSLKNWTSAGYVREDGEQVYYRPAGGGAEAMLYDGTLRQGDTAEVSSMLCFGQGVQVIITDYDTVLVNGTPRRRWQLTCADIYFSDTWIEGIGSLHGPVYGVYGCCIVCPSWQLMCWYSGDTLMYQSPGFSQCYLSSVGIADTHQPEPLVHLTPNPVRRGETVELHASTEIELIILYTMTGSVAKVLYPRSAEIYDIPTHGLSQEMYLVVVISSDGRPIRRKLLVW